jgi:hypothetical protein
VDIRDLVHQRVSIKIQLITDSTESYFIIAFNISERHEIYTRDQTLLRYYFREKPRQTEKINSYPFVGSWVLVGHVLRIKTAGIKCVFSENVSELLRRHMLVAFTFYIRNKFQQSSDNLKHVSELARASRRKVGTEVFMT